MIGKRLINTGVAAAGALVPSEHFETVTYTGNGGTQRIGGYINRGGVFNGSSSKITSSVPKSSDQSFSFWTNHGSQSNSTATYFGYSNSASNGFFSIAISSGTNISILYWNGSTYARNTSTINIADNNWHHVVVTTSGNVFNIYIDGNTTPAYTTTLSGFTHASRSDLQISYETPDGSLSYFNGKIDQFRVFDKVISSSEITTLYGETYASSTVSTTDIFNDDSGVALYQLDGNANDTGGVSGYIGEGGIFNGSTSQISFNNTGFPSTNITVSAWIKPSATFLANGISGIVAWGNSASGQRRSLVYYQGGQIGYSGYFAASNFTGTTVLPTEQWSHIAFTLSGGTVTLYINGSFEGSGTVTVNSYSSSTAFIGTTEITGTNEHFNGSIDQVRIFNKALSSSEVTTLYNETSATASTFDILSDSSAVALYQLDGDARDTGNLYDGTATNVSYAYNGTATNVTYQEATKFQPDLVWIKHRGDTGTYHQIYDSVRGATKVIFSNDTLQEFDRTNGLTSFDSNGFSLGNHAHSNDGTAPNDLVAWCFKGGGTAVSNTDGTITSQVSANQDAGFSIVKYTKSGTSGTMGHGLSSAPELIMEKRTDGVAYWNVRISGITNNNQTIYLNQTTEVSTHPTLNLWSTPTASVFGYDSANAAAGNYIAYCFNSVEGFSKIGSYTGTGAAGNLVVTGFEPAFIMIKNTTDANDWYILDNERSPSNPRNEPLYANLSSAESVNDAFITVDFLSNGFKLNGSSGGTNASGKTYIYLAIAADPDTTTPVVEDSFDVVTYTGDGVNAKSVDVDFKPDLVWIKSRTSALSNVIHDSIRGSGPLLITDSTTAEINNGSNTVEFTEDGFDLQGGASHTSVNGADDFVAWCWKAGDHDDNLPQINTEGTIDSVVSVNAAAGFSIVKYNSATTPSTNFTIGHGLSSTPEMIITKVTSTGGDWYVWNKDLSNISTNYLRLNASDAEATLANMWGTGHTATTIGLRTSASASTNHSHVAYCFHSVDGYQKIGSYTGNGSTTGPIVTLGFQPRFLMLKLTTTTGGNWQMMDSTRGEDIQLYANLSNSEGSAYNGVDFLSNGFQLKTSYVEFNGSGQTYIYLAIA